jgi:hypothetical protein
MESEDDDRTSFGKSLWLSHPRGVRIGLLAIGLPVWVGWMALTLSGEFDSPAIDGLFVILMILAAISTYFVVRALWNNKV